MSSGAHKHQMNSLPIKENCINNLKVIKKSIMTAHAHTHTQKRQAVLQLQAAAITWRNVTGATTPQCTIGQI